MALPSKPPESIDPVITRDKQQKVYELVLAGVRSGTVKLDPGCTFPEKVIKTATELVEEITKVK